MTSPESQDRLEILIQQLDRLATTLERQQSFKRKLLSGVVIGLGTAIGASLVATIVLFGLKRILGYAGIQLPPSS